jgi:hypothetical protein
MSQPPPSDSGNVVDPEVLASRRARRAEVGEEATLELRLYDAERRLGEVAAERDALRSALEAHERDLRSTRQREWSEQQQRLEAQGEAAATRELAGSRVAKLRERLADAEAEVAVVAAERDRARAALEVERQGARADRRRREALEREHVALREELERRTALTNAAAAAVSDARRELASERASRVDMASLEARLVVERRELAARVTAVEGAVAAVRERLGAAARVLREKVAAERSAREAAEAALVVQRDEAARALAAERSGAEVAQAQAAALERDLARRVEVEGQLRAALEALQAELQAVRAGDGVRTARLAARVESVMAIAAGLRDGVRRELSAEQEAFTAALAAMQARVAELQDGVAAAAAVREELEAERAARWVAEAELDAERRRGDADRAARTFAETRLADVEAELEELRAAARPASLPDAAAVASLRDALEQLRAPATEPGTAPAEPPSLGFDLAAAAARLRAAAIEAEEEAEAEEEVEPEPEEEVEAEAAPDPEPEPVRSPLPSRSPVTRPGPWLRDALVALAVHEPDIAELMLVALLPAQGGLVKRPVVYELAVQGSATHRVGLAPDRARVLPPGGGIADARVAGPLEALVPLVAGGAGRRLPGTQIESRRALRRLLKARRAPLGLAQLAQAGVAPSPGLLLTVLARAVQPSWTAGRRLTVDIAPAGADRWRVVASGDGPLTILPAEGADPAEATLHTSEARLAAVLGGTAEPGEAWVEGDVGAVRTLLSWLDRAQRGDR